MTNGRILALVLVTALISSLAAWSVRPVVAQDAGYRGLKWEYRVFSMDPADYSNKSDYKEILAREGMRKVDAVFREYVLNHLGGEGWELISVEPRAKNLFYFNMKRRKL